MLKVKSDVIVFIAATVSTIAKLKQMTHILLMIFQTISVSSCTFPTHPIKYNHPIMHSMHAHNTNRHQISTGHSADSIFSSHHSKLKALLLFLFFPCSQFHSSAALKQVQSS